MMISNEIKSQVLIQALPYIKKYSGQIVVIKYGGNAMINEELKDAVMNDIVLLTQIGIKVVLVHGGGPEISAALKQMNIQSTFVGGLRKTDEETVKVVQMVLAGKVNKDLVNLIQLRGGNAIGLCGIDGHMLTAEKINDDLGFVGDITEVNSKPILDALSLGYIPVISSVACDGDGNVYNVNADTAAAKIAGELRAHSMISLTDIEGLLEDVNDPASLIPDVSIGQVPRMIKEGIISGGMIPKIDCCVEAIRRGVKQVAIIDGRVPHSILVELLSDKGIGTLFH
ncbi:MAG: acetylglutamate kinase [Clostridia bacterium]|nr:acetylglutamate kinase [Clostridia bacterium]